MQSNYTRLSFQELNGDGIPSLLLLRTNSDNQPVAEFALAEGSLSVSHRCALSSTRAGAESGQCGHRQAGQDTPAAVHHRHNSQGIAVTDILVCRRTPGSSTLRWTAVRGSPPPRLPIVS